jgi:hypothetical protein
MREFFVVTNSFAAPFFSDTDHKFIEGETPEIALSRLAATYDHPAGLYAAVLYESADAYHKGAKPLAKWLCNHEIEKMRLTEDLGSFSYRGDGPGRFEINGKHHVIDNPKGGRLVQSAH